MPEFSSFAAAEHQQIIFNRAHTFSIRYIYAGGLFFENRLARERRIGITAFASDESFFPTRDGLPSLRWNRYE